MPAGKRQQSNTVLFTLVLFVGLFIVASVVAVVFYTKSEDYKTRAATLERDIDALANSSELPRLPSLVGSKNADSYLGVLLNYLDQASVLTVGPKESTSAEVKFGVIAAETAKAVDIAQKYLTLETIDPNTGLVPIITKLGEFLDATLTAKNALEDDLKQLNAKVESALAQINATEKALNDEKDIIFQEKVKVVKDYRALEDQRNQAADERVDTVKQQLGAERNRARQLNQDLLKNQAELEQSQGKLENALADVRKIEPIPDRELAAYKPDGKVILIDDATGTVHLDLGSDDRIYRGLTFSIYDRGSSIQKDGQSKAEVEVYGLAKNYSLARIVNPNPRNPIALGDSAANLIWDKTDTKTFVLIGEYDLDKNGVVEAEAPDRIASLIAQWGGKVDAEVSIATDIVIVGNLPRIPEKPSFEDEERNPLARGQYEAAQKKRAHFEAVQEQAKDLMIPMFKYNKFLYLIGYTSQVEKLAAAN